MTTMICHGDLLTDVYHLNGERYEHGVWLSETKKFVPQSSGKLVKSEAETILALEERGYHIAPDAYAGR